MSAIKIATRPPTSAGRLYPRYERGAKLIALESRVARRWPHGVNVDGTLVFDLDEERVLANLDIHVPRDQWMENRDVAWPGPASKADIVFDEATVETKAFTLPVEVLTDSGRRVVEVVIGARGPAERWELSESCYALTRGDALVGSC